MTKTQSFTFNESDDTITVVLPNNAYQRVTVNIKTGTVGLSYKYGHGCRQISFDNLTKLLWSLDYGNNIYKGLDHVKLPSDYPTEQAELKVETENPVVMQKTEYQKKQRKPSKSNILKNANTIGEVMKVLIDVAQNGTKEDQIKAFADYVELIEISKEVENIVSTDNVVDVARKNINYMSGYYDTETCNLVRQTYNVTEPTFLNGNNVTIITY